MLKSMWSHPDVSKFDRELNGETAFRSHMLYTVNKQIELISVEDRVCEMMV